MIRTQSRMYGPDHDLSKAAHLLMMRRLESLFAADTRRAIQAHRRPSGLHAYRLRRFALVC